MFRPLHDKVLIGREASLTCIKFMATLTNDKLPPAFLWQVAYKVNKSDLALFRINFNRFNTLCGGWCGCDNTTWGYREAVRDVEQYGKDVYICKVGLCPSPILQVWASV